MIGIEASEAIAVTGVARFVPSARARSGLAEHVDLGLELSSGGT